MIDQPINSAAKMTPLQTAFCYTIIGDCYAED